MARSLRVGRFLISDFLLEGGSESDKISEILAELKIAPIRVEHLYHVGAFEYIAVSSRFDEVEGGAHIPTYELVVTIGADGKPEGIDLIKEVTRGSNKD